jgi:HK97 family phage major capsid protein
VIEQIRERLRALLDERAAKQAAIDTITAAAEARGDDLTEAEAAEFRAAFDAVKALDAERTDLEARVAELEDIEARKAAAAAAAAALPAATIATAGAAVVRRDERTYNPDAERRGVSFLRDVVEAFTGGDFEARDRLARHSAEERAEGLEVRAVGTGAFDGLTVPQYLTDLVAPNRKAGRVFADLCTSHPMPASGMTVNISRITTGTSTAIQSTQNSNVSETDMDDTLLTIPVQTIGGRQQVSRQALERSTGVESIILSDLVRDYDVRVDQTLLNQATTGLAAAAGASVTYTSGSPTVAGLWPTMFNAIQQIQTAVFMGADAILMHPRRFWWIASQVGTSFPFINTAGAGENTGGSVLGTGYGQGPSGFLAGLPVYVDANIVTNLGVGTNQDEIYVLSRSECHLWEDGGMFIRAEQPAANQLGVQLVVYGYVAYTHSRYASANGKIGGTGLTAPSFA